jgi:hypothetical protein
LVQVVGAVEVEVEAEVEIVDVARDGDDGVGGPKVSKK